MGRHHQDCRHARGQSGTGEAERQSARLFQIPDPEERKEWKGASYHRSSRQGAPGRAARFLAPSAGDSVAGRSLSFLFRVRPAGFFDGDARNDRRLTGGARGGALLARLAAVGSPLFKRFSDPPAFADEGLVIVSSPFFPHKLVNGYDNPILQVVKNINGHPIKNLTELVSYLRDCKDEFITIEFDLRGAETLVFPRAEMLTATDEILADNGLRSQGSADTLAIWNAGKSK